MSPRSTAIVSQVVQAAAHAAGALMSRILERRDQHRCAARIEIEAGNVKVILMMMADIDMSHVERRAELFVRKKRIFHRGVAVDGDRGQPWIAD